MVNRIRSRHHFDIHRSEETPIRLHHLDHNGPWLEHIGPLLVSLVIHSLSEREELEQQGTLLSRLQKHLIFLAHNVPCGWLGAFAVSEPVFPLLVQVVDQLELGFFLSMDLGVEDFYFEDFGNLKGVGN